ncbi:MAG: hypothetical protein Q9168_002685 [Polycauliona sp. 1 TL-2023]
MEVTEKKANRFILVEAPEGDMLAYKESSGKKSRCLHEHQVPHVLKINTVLQCTRCRKGDYNAPTGHDTGQNIRNYNIIGFELYFFGELALVTRRSDLVMNQGTWSAFANKAGIMTAPNGAIYSYNGQDWDEDEGLYYVKPNGRSEHQN